MRMLLCFFTVYYRCILSYCLSKWIKIVNVNISFHAEVLNKCSVVSVTMATIVSCSKWSVCQGRCWTPELEPFWSACLPQPTAVYFRDREGPWATHSHLALIVCPGGPGLCLWPPPLPPTVSLYPRPHLLLMVLFFPLASLSLRRSLFSSHRLCLTGTCTPTEALSYTKKPKLAFICSPLPAVCIVFCLGIEKKV